MASLKQLEVEVKIYIDGELKRVIARQAAEAEHVKTKIRELATATSKLVALSSRYFSATGLPATAPEWNALEDLDEKAQLLKKLVADVSREPKDEHDIAWARMQHQTGIAVLWNGSPQNPSYEGGIAWMNGGWTLDPAGDAVFMASSDYTGQFGVTVRTWAPRSDMENRMVVALAHDVSGEGKGLYYWCQSGEVSCSFVSERGEEWYKPALGHHD